MNIYSRIYNNIVSKNVNNKIHWKEKNLHRHHIIPKHHGGLDEESNYTYLTVREHIIAHFLLWKIHGKINDLRSMYMLGAKLTRLQRQLVGKWCYENKISVFSEKYDNQRSDWSRRGVKTQIDNKIGIHNPDNFKKFASMGGKATAKSDKRYDFRSWDKETLKDNASRAAKTHKGKRAMYKPGDSSFKRVAPDKWDYYLELGYIFGSPIKHNKCKGMEFPHRRKKIVINGITYDSTTEAMSVLNLNYYQIKKLEEK